MLGFSGHRQWVYPRLVSGRFRSAHRYAAVAQHLVLFGIPLLPIAGHPALQLDLAARRVYALGGVFSANDSILLMLFALIAAFSLFFFTSILGRFWCGYLCPQTVFIEEWIRPIEHFIEGERGARVRLDAAPWTGRKLLVKAIKQLLFVAVALVLSVGMMAYFTGPSIWVGGASNGAYAMTAILTGTWYLDFAWFREQMCTYVCPYARFQGALTDDHSLVVHYDAVKGEPRSRAARDVGGCVDCGKCAAVCPAGIDIRDGYQLECINCASCVDACESVMPKLGHPSLVRYSTALAEQTGQASRLVRPRTVMYGALLTVLSIAVTTIIVRHEPFEVQLARMPGEPFFMAEDGSVRNNFFLTIKSNDPSPEPLTYTVRVDGLPTAETSLAPITLQSLERVTRPVVVQLPVDQPINTLPFALHVESAHGTVVIHNTFLTRGTARPTEG